MTTINAALFQTLMNDTTIPDATAVIVLDHSINLLNTYGAGLTGLVAGTGTYTSAQSGAIMTLSKTVYSQIYKNASGANATLGGVSVSYASDSQLLSFAKRLANELFGSSFERV